MSLVRRPCTNCKKTAVHVSEGNEKLIVECKNCGYRTETEGELPYELP